MCKETDESLDNLFLYCPLVVSLWWRVFHLVEQDWVFPPAYETMLSIDFTGFGSNVEAQDLWRCVISCGSLGFMTRKECYKF